jgi:hypothetical protein
VFSLCDRKYEAMAPMKGKKKMTTYAMEFVNEDGDLQVILFNEEGPQKSFISQARSGKYEELAFDEVFLTKVIGDYKHEGVAGHYFQGIMQMRFAEDGESVSSFDVVASFDKDDWVRMYDMALKLDDVPLVKN